MNEEMLKEILMFRYNPYCAYLFTNVSANLRAEISAFVKNSEANLVTLELSTYDLDFDRINNEKDIILKKILYESTITSILANQIITRFSEEKIFDKIKKIVNGSFETILGSDNLNFMWFSYIEEMTRQLNLKGINVAINIYIDKDDPFIQKILNNLLNDRHNYKIRMITPNDDLVTYFEDGGILCEEMHDFHTVNLKSFKTLHQKSL